MAKSTPNSGVAPPEPQPSPQSSPEMGRCGKGGTAVAGGVWLGPGWAWHILGGHQPCQAPQAHCLPTCLCIM